MERISKEVRGREELYPVVSLRRAAEPYRKNMMSMAECSKLLRWEELREPWPSVKWRRVE
jgi:hypothetical protein